MFDASYEARTAEVESLLEAARWAPSAQNHQPRRFVVARRGTETFDTIVGALLSFNAMWAGHASALVVALAETSTVEGDDRPTAEYDLGQAIAALTVQAHAEGLHVHQMAGIDAAGLAAAFGLPERFVPFTVTAIGTVATSPSATGPGGGSPDAGAGGNPTVTVGITPTVPPPSR